MSGCLVLINDRNVTAEFSSVMAKIKREMHVFTKSCHNQKMSVVEKNKLYE